MKRSSGWEISNSLRINLPIRQGSGYRPLSVSPRLALLWFMCFTVSLCWLLSHSLLLPPALFVPLSICLLLSPPSSLLLHCFPLFLILHASFSLSEPLHLSLRPPPPFSSDTHREWCTNTIPHISNEYLVIILSPQRLSVWLRLSLDSVTNGTASFSTAAIPQRWQTEMWCGSCEHSSEGL